MGRKEERRVLIVGHKEAIRRIVADSGKHFDPAVVGVLLRVARRKGIIE